MMPISSTRRVSDQTTRLITSRTSVTSLTTILLSTNAINVDLLLDLNFILNILRENSDLPLSLLSLFSLYSIVPYHP